MLIAISLGFAALARDERLSRLDGLVLFAGIGLAQIRLGKIGATELALG